MSTPSLKATLLGAVLSLPALITATPAPALDLLSAGWAFTPASPGACPTPGVDFDCYENRTATDINIIGSDSSSGSNTTAFSYTLGGGGPSQQVSFSYSFTDSSIASIAYYQIGSSSPSLLLGSGSIPLFQWDPSQTLTFSVDQNGSNAYAGQLAITSFSSLPLTPPPAGQPVPAPLPGFGAIACFMLSRTLRRRIEAGRTPCRPPH